MMFGKQHRVVGMRAFFPMRVSVNLALKNRAPTGYRQNHQEPLSRPYGSDHENSLQALAPGQSYDHSTDIFLLDAKSGRKIRRTDRTPPHTRRRPEPYPPRGPPLA